MYVDEVKFFAFTGNELPNSNHRRYGKRFNIQYISRIGYEVHLKDCRLGNIYVKSNACLYNQQGKPISKNEYTYTWANSNGNCNYTGSFWVSWRRGTYKLQIWIGDVKIKKFFFEIV